MNKTLIAIALVTGVLCGIWAGAAPAFNLSVWAGFAGCTTYFACGKQGWAGLRMTLLTNLLGILGGYIMFEAQVFNDGNKRLAWLSTVVFLELNGVELDVDQSEAAQAIRALGARDGGRREDEHAVSLTLPEFTQWLGRCVGFSGGST